MDAGRWRRIREVFEDTAELPMADRNAFLAQACGDDAELRGKVEELLAADTSEGAREYLEQGPRGMDFHAPAPGTRFGRYVIVRVLGSGGMGTVYEANQESPARAVALKVMRSGLRSAGARRRFHDESEILARLRHPGIAQVYEAGTHPAGDGIEELPYFALELVEGATDLVTWARGLELGGKLRLLIQVADAVHHGHQKGVIHRDLKPGNVLVDAQGRPKVIDFGIARCTDKGLERETLLTQPGQVLGTLAFMSPEQVDGRHDEVDTRSDVYSLGVIAYLVLGSVLPHDLEGKSLSQAAALICDREPPRLGALDRKLRGDLETIAGKAMAKDRERRYASASDLARDLERFLRNEPILARPPSTGYQLRKFARRHRALVAGAATSLLLLLAGIVAVSLQNARVNAENRKARWVSGFLRGVLAEADALEARGSRFTVREALDDASRRIAAEEWSDPGIEAEIRDVIGVTYLNMSAAAQAEPHLVRALELRRELLGEDARETLQSASSLVLLRRDQDRLDEAARLARVCAERCRQSLGEDDPLTLSAAHNLALLQKETGEHGEAEALYRSTLERRRRILGGGDRDTLHTLHNLGKLLGERGSLAEAETLLAEALERRESALGADHPDTLATLDVLGGVLRDQGELSRAEAHHRRALRGFEARLGDEHANTLGARFHLAWVLLLQAKAEEAESIARAALATCRRVNGDEHRYTLLLLRILASALQQMGKGADAAVLFREAWEVARQTKGAAHRDTIAAAHDLAVCLERTERHAECIEVIEGILDLPGLTREWRAKSLMVQGRCLAATGKLAEAERSLTESLEEFRRAPGGGGPWTRATLDALIALYEASDRPEDLRRCRELRAALR